MDFIRFVLASAIHGKTLRAAALFMLICDCR